MQNDQKTHVEPNAFIAAVRDEFMVDIDNLGDGPILPSMVKDAMQSAFKRVHEKMGPVVFNFKVGPDPDRPHTILFSWSEPVMAQHLEAACKGDAP